MKLNVLLVAGVVSSWALMACTPQAKNEAQNLGEVTQSQTGIINGTDVKAEDKLAESIVAVYDAYTGQLCTGSLLPSNLVLTAAHCVGPFPEAMVVFFDIQPNEKSEYRAIDKLEVSPYWETRQMEDKNTGDIALLHFTGTAPAKYKPSAFLPAASQKQIKPGANVVVAGYGLTDGVKKIGAGKLRTTKIKIADHKFSASEVSLDQSQGTGACHGDSGGPAYIEVGGKYFLWGVTSRGLNDEANDCSKQAVYTNALYYKSWLNRVANKLTTALGSPESTKQQ